MHYPHENAEQSEENANAQSPAVSDNMKFMVQNNFHLDQTNLILVCMLQHCSLAPLLRYAVAAVAK